LDWRGICIMDTRVRACIPFSYCILQI
jgi:hypothetical protein